jgi:hypothetical protein
VHKAWHLSSPRHLVLLRTHTQHWSSASSRNEHDQTLTLSTGTSLAAVDREGGKEGDGSDDGSGCAGRGRAGAGNAPSGNSRRGAGERLPGARELPPLHAPCPPLAWRAISFSRLMWKMYPVTCGGPWGSRGTHLSSKSASYLIPVKSREKEMCSLIYLNKFLNIYYYI